LQIIRFLMIFRYTLFYRHLADFYII